MIVDFTGDARRDLIEIGEVIATDNPARAASFTTELVDKCLSLAEFLKRYPVAHQRGQRRVRKMPLGRYLVFYTVHIDQIEIDRIIHSARRWQRLVR